MQIGEKVRSVLEEELLFWKPECQRNVMILFLSVDGSRKLGNRIRRIGIDAYNTEGIAETSMSSVCLG
jgi:hypothetical protein